MSCGVRRLSIDSLSPDINNALVIGVIIAKQSAKRFVSKIDGLERGVWCFTLRDSPNDTINVSWWCTWDKASSLCTVFTIGDVVEVINAKITFVPVGDSGMKFRPAVSSPFTLELAEHRNNDVIPHMEQDSTLIRNLMKIPTKADGNFLRLSDVSGHGKSMTGQFVNLLVAVARVGAVRTVVTRKTSESVPCRDLSVMDETERDFPITLWDLDILHLADDWKPSKTILFLADVTVSYNSFKKAITANLSSRTVVTVDPETPEAMKLREYVASVPLERFALLEQISEDIGNTKDALSDPVMTTAQVLDKAYSNDIPGGQFSAILYAHVTQFDLDGAERIFMFKCSNCGVTCEENDFCTNSDCLVVIPSQLTPVFSIRVNITDHRGSLIGCRLTGIRAAAVLGCTEEAFLALSLEERTERKWRILLQRCAVRIVALCVSAGRSQPMISVISCEPVDIDTVSAKLPFH